MRKAWWVCYNCLGDEGFVCLWIGLYAGPPTPLEHFEYHLPFAGNLAIADACKLGNYAWIIDHISHQLFGIPPNREEVKSGIFDEGLENVVSGKSDFVT